MPVEFWTGGEFDYSHERKAEDQVVRAFQARFERVVYPVIVVFNVFCNGKPLDLLILKPDAILVVDFKECSSPLRASENGNWQILTGGELLGNPFRQVRDYRFALRDFLIKHASEFLRPQKAPQADFGPISAVVAISPSLHPGSINSIGREFPFFHLVGLDRLPNLVEQITNKNLAFSHQELRKFVEHVLKCQPQRMAQSTVVATAKPEFGLTSSTSAKPVTTAMPTAPLPAVEPTPRKVENPGVDGIQRGVRLFRYLSQQANLGRAVGIAYGDFVAFLHGKDSFREVVGRHFLPGDNPKVIELAWKVTDAAGGRIEVTQRSRSIKSGMDTFIWNKKPPHDRPEKAFCNPKCQLPYSQTEWSAIFPGGLRRLATDRELTSLA
ncbi:MAG: nuclease-related domain-containing protein [Terriglobia bacterium]